MDIVEGLSVKRIDDLNIETTILNRMYKTKSSNALCHKE